MNFVLWTAIGMFLVGGVYDILYRRRAGDFFDKKSNDYFINAMALRIFSIVLLIFYLVVAICKMW